MARTEIVGGATSGYSLIGSEKMDSSPAARTDSDSTTAKMGRSMKKREKRTRESSVNCHSERSEESQGSRQRALPGGSRSLAGRLGMTSARCECSRVGHRRALGQHFHA